MINLICFCVGLWIGVYGLPLLVRVLTASERAALHRAPRRVSLGQLLEDRTDASAQEEPPVPRQRGRHTQEVSHDERTSAPRAPVGPQGRRRSGRADTDLA